jgi:hypothetical protein
MISHSVSYFVQLIVFRLIPNHVESQDELMDKYKKLIAQKNASN